MQTASAGSKRSREHGAAESQVADDAAMSSAVVDKSSEARAAQRVRLNEEPAVAATQPRADVAAAAAGGEAAPVSALSVDHPDEAKLNPAAGRYGLRRTAARSFAAFSRELQPPPNRDNHKEEPEVEVDLGDPMRAPIRRCDADSFSLVFSFLNTSDFLCAICVSRYWRATSFKHSAWPKLHLPSFIQSLRDENYDDLAKRRLVVTISHEDESRLSRLLGGPAAHSGSSAAAASGSGASISASAHAASMWRHVTDVKLRMIFRSPSERRRLNLPGIQPPALTPGEVADRRVCSGALLQIAQLPYLSALNLYNYHAAIESVQALYSALSNRLQALLLFGGSRHLYSHLPWLPGLRVLVLNGEPHPTVLAPLHRLVYLHFEIPSQWVQQVAVPVQLCDVMRWLSEEHQLRTLSITGNYSQTATDWTGLEHLFRPAVKPAATRAGATTQPGAALSQSPQAAGGPALPAVDWSKPCGLTDVSIVGRISGAILTSLCALPQLTRLNCESRPLRWLRYGFAPFEEAAQPLHVLANLQQLQLRIDHNRTTGLQLDWPHLQQCNRLCVLQLSHRSMLSGSNMLNLTVPQSVLQGVLAANARTLEELRLGFNIEYDEQPQQDETAAADASSSSADHLAAPNAHADWSAALALCTRLREVEIPLQPDAPTTVYETLAQLPAFQSLQLTFRGCPLLPPNLLQCISQSRSWCSLKLFRFHGKPADLLTVQGGLQKKMPPADADDETAKRLRVYGLKSKAATSSFGIRRHAHGVKEWQLLSS